MMKNAFYQILKVIFILKVFKILSWLFSHVEETGWLKVSFKIYVTTWLAIKCNAHIAQSLAM